MAFTAPRHPWLDCSEAPLYVITVPVTMTDQELSEFLAALTRLYDGLGHEIAYVIDASKVASLPGNQRKLIDDTEKAYRFQDFRWNRGQAFVVDNAIIRGIISVIWFVSRAPYPTKVFATKAPAMAWARERLAKSKVA